MKNNLLLLLLSFMSFCISAQQKFVIDRTFGDLCGSTEIFAQPKQYELFKLSDGKYLIVGDFFGDNESNKIVFIKYNNNGTIDTTFSPSGIKLFNFSNHTKVTCASYFNNKIYISGHQAEGNAYSSFRASISRFNEDCTPDSTFNGTGTLIEPVFSNPISSSFYTHLLVQPDEKIVCFGYESSNSNGGSNIAVGKRYNPNGSVDSTFNTNNSNFGYPSFLQGIADYYSPGILESDGSMRFSYPAFSGFNRIVSVKLDANGNQVTSYGNNGSNVTSIEVNQNRIHRFLKAGNNIYGVHEKQNADDDMRTFSLDANGNPNIDFSGDGVWDLPPFPGSTGTERPFAMHLDSQNKLYFFGTGSFNTQKSVFYRTDLSGNLDSTLSGNGGHVLNEFNFGEFRTAYFENDSTIIASMFANSRVVLVKMQLKASNISISSPGDGVICLGASTDIQIENPSSCYAYSWTKNGEAFGDNGSSINVTNAGEYMVTASASGEISFSQPLIIIVEDCTEIEDLKPRKVEIFPNPTYEYCVIKSSNDNESWTLLDVTGKILKEFLTNSEGYLLDLSAFDSGIYFIRNTNNGETSKLLKLK